MGFLDWVKGVNEQLEPQGYSAPPPPTTHDILNALDRTQQLAVDAKLHPVVIARVNRVIRLVRDTMPRIENQGLGSSDFYSVMATATDYLPEALSAYLRLPRDWADSRPIENGKTALMLLIDQLDLLGSTMEQIYDAACRADATALVAHGRFLQEKFGQTNNGGELGLADTAMHNPAAPEASPAPYQGMQAPTQARAPQPSPTPRNPLDLE